VSGGWKKNSTNGSEFVLKHEKGLQRDHLLRSDLRSLLVCFRRRIRLICNHGSPVRFRRVVFPRRVPCVCIAYHGDAIDRLELRLRRLHGIRGSQLPADGLGDMHPEVSGEPERRDVDALVVAVEARAEHLKRYLVAKQTAPYATTPFCRKKRASVALNRPTGT
jgi:hypothetical protein